MDASLLVSALYAATAVVIFCCLGWTLQHRTVSAEARLAIRLYAVWWYGMAGATGIDAGRDLLAAAGATDVALHLVLMHVGLLALCAAVWGLLYYVVFLLMGRGRTLPILTAFFLANYLLIVLYLNLAQPVAVGVAPWSSNLVFANPSVQALLPVLFVLVGVPLAAALVGLFTLNFLAPTPGQRLRALAVPVATLVWLESLLLPMLPALAHSDLWQVASRVAGLCAAIALLMAYQPPAWVGRLLAAKAQAVQPADG